MNLTAKIHVGLPELEVTIPHHNPGGHYRYFLYVWKCLLSFDGW